MNKNILNIIKSNFSKEDIDIVVSKLKTITLNHVMANSQNNLDNTWIAILKLSQGDLNELDKYIDAAKKDFRDVIYWASLEHS